MGADSREHLGIICMEFRGKRGQGLGKGLWGEVCVCGRVRLGIFL